MCFGYIYFFLSSWLVVSFGCMFGCLVDWLPLFCYINYFFLFACFPSFIFMFSNFLSYFHFLSNILYSLSSLSRFFCLVFITSLFVFNFCRVPFLFLLSLVVYLSFVFLHFVTVFAYHIFFYFSLCCSSSILSHGCVSYSSFVNVSPKTC